jgi:hypothetical protein
LAITALAACPPATPGPTDSAGGDAVEVDTNPPGCGPADPDFDDHTLHGFATPAALLDFAGAGQTPVQAKFVLTTFQEPECGRAYYMDNGFYTLHDEWYWFRLLNGAAVEGVDLKPLEGQSYPSIAAIYKAFGGGAVLPLGLTVTGDGRIYSPLFYNLALTAPRGVGVGSILHYPANPDRVIPEELWLFELEYPDQPSETEIGAFFDRLALSLPLEVAAELRWLARSSPKQETLAAAIRAGGGPYAQRVLTYSDLVVPGEVIAYNEGITAGRIKRFAKDTLGNASVSPEDIVVLESVPDDLPPVSGISTAQPQTPLAHLNLLAKARGTPNAYVAGVYDDPKLEEWEWFLIPAIYKVASDDVRFHAITNAQYNEWQGLKGKPSFEIVPVDVASKPYWVDLQEGDFAAIDELKPIAGGKCTGMLALGTLDGAELPMAPGCVTIRAYREHVASFEPMIQAFLTEPSFAQDRRVRFAVLEGADGFKQEHAGDPEAVAWLESWQAGLPPDSQTALIVAGGGLRATIRQKPVAAAALAVLLTELEARYGELTDTQALRFRSSSNVEDIVGFNGAGLYDSNPGYLHPEAQPTPKLQERSVEWGLKKTWASYWSFGAFEERRVAGIDHLAGSMAVLVHPAFSDDLELANGVMTFSIARGKTATSYELVVNMQKGALSVTNPPPGSTALPEVDRLFGDGAEPPPIERVQGSTEVPAGTYLLSDGELLTIFHKLKQLASGWLDHQNLAKPAKWDSSTLVLDFELKRMAAGWPELKSGATAAGDRVVYKQVRTLEQPITVPEAIVALPIPRDILSVAAGVRQWTCQTPHFDLVALEVSTDPGHSALLPYDKLPFTARLQVTFAVSPPGFAVPTGAPVPLDHPQLDLVAHPGMPTGPWAFSATLPQEVASQTGFDQLAVGADGTWRLASGATVLEGTGASCTAQDLLVGPSAYLEQILEAAGH